MKSSSFGARLKSSLVITLIESVGFAAGVGAWFALERAGNPVAGLVVGTVVWTVITLVEHFVALLPPFYKPPVE